MQQSIAQDGPVLLDVNSLPRHSVEFNLQVPDEGHEKRGGQWEGRSVSSRATSMISLLGEQRQDMAELFDNQRVEQPSWCLAASVFNTMVDRLCINTQLIWLNFNTWLN